LEIPSRSDETASKPATSFVHGGKTISYYRNDETTEKFTTAPILSEPQPKPPSAETSRMSILRVRLPDGIELFFDSGSRTVVSISSPVGMTGTSATYTIVADIA